MDSCSLCGTPFGKRRRCYVCNPGNPRTGETRQCLICGKSFYAQQNEIADVARGTKSFCSRACKGAAMAVKPKPWAKPTEKTQHSAGYVLIWMPEHPRAANGRVLEHVVVAERVLGRLLDSQREHVHHLNGDKTDNRPENLAVLSPSEHQKLHAATDHIQVQPRRIKLVCQECGKTFDAEYGRAYATVERNRRKFCSMACRRAAWPREMVAKRKAKRAAD